MRILVVSSYPPSRQSGGRVRLRALMRGLAESHSVSLLSFVSTTEERAALDELRADYDQVVAVPNDRIGAAGMAKRGLQLRSLFSMRSFERFTCERSAFQTALDRVVARSQFDIVHVEGCFMSHYDFPRGACVVMDEQNIEYEVLRRVVSVTKASPRKLYSHLDYLKLRSEEQRSWRAADACAVTSPRDEALLRQVLPQARAAVVPNGVDLDFFAPAEARPDRGTILFFGQISYYPNTDALLFFLRDVFPLLLRSHPSLRLVIVGPSAPPAIQRWASPNVIITGPVDDVRPYLRAAQAVIVPLRIGGGTRLKILEAMAMGKAVVSTRLGAEGLAVTDQRDILLADGAEAFATEVRRVLEDDDLAAGLGGAARRLVEAQYDWRSSVRSLEALYRSAMLARVSANAA
jgi:glycosyltransferase involved in cell wall biosynthesis